MEQTNQLTHFIANRIKYLRKQQKLSQEQLSLQAGLDIKYINKLENYRFNVRVDTLEKILDSLNITYQDFFEFEKIYQNPLIDELLDTLNPLTKEEQNEKLKAILQLLR